VNGVAESLVKLMVNLLELESSEVTVDSLKQNLSSIATLSPFSSLTPSELEWVEKRVLSRVQVVMAAATVVVDTSWIPWINQRRHEIDDYYWSRYIKYLEDIRHVPQNVRVELDNSTQDVLDLTYDPTAEGPWDRRGLVMGNVQSGKTQHYTGLIAKAADAGYKIIIVIAGVHNNLRNQTQERIDEAFVGRRWSGIPGTKHEDVGVSLLQETDGSRQPASFTGASKDFSKASAQSLNLPLASLRVPAVFVIKKNTKTLAELTEWLRGWNVGHGGKILEPLLLIDDEADNASIDVGGGSGISQINKRIRELLSLFERSTYVGYTATPFANIFIDPSSEDEMVKEDLFPRSFIIDLEPPSNYLGPQKVFLSSPSQFVRNVVDNEAFLPLSHKISWVIEELPPSLMRALYCYLLSRSIRTLRNDGLEHSAMMVNVSRFNSVQEQVQLLINDELDRVRNAVRSFGGLGEQAVVENALLSSIRDVYLDEYRESGFSFLEVLGEMHKAISPIDVVLVNMTRKQDPLKYDRYRQQGRHVVAIGGLSLSRGLTLEGLTISYFLRNSKMYDTLLQMGRWFGYRNHYEDLVRIWMTEDSSEWYEHITEVIEELRSELRIMADSRLSPKDFGLKVRRHPASLLITARNKFGRYDEITLSTSFSNRLVETVRIRTDEIDENRSAFEWIGSELVKAGYDVMPKDSRLEIHDVEPSIVLDFLARFKNEDSAKTSLSSQLVLKYLSEMRDEIQSWDIAVPCPESTPQSGIARKQVKFLGYEFLTQLRTPRSIRKENSNLSFLVSAKQRASSRGVEMFGLDDVEVEEVKRAHPGMNLADKHFRAVRKKPLLMLHFISPIPPINDPENEKYEPFGSELIQVLERDFDRVYRVWGISFPNYGSRDRGVEAKYHVNDSWIRNEFGSSDLEGEEFDDE
jgi:hypothetical protein